MQEDSRKKKSQSISLEQYIESSSSLVEDNGSSKNRRPLTTMRTNKLNAAITLNDNGGKGTTKEQHDSSKPLDLSPIDAEERSEKADYNNNIPIDIETKDALRKRLHRLFLEKSAEKDINSLIGRVNHSVIKKDTDNNSTTDVEGKKMNEKNDSKNSSFASTMPIKSDNLLSLGMKVVKDLGEESITEDDSFWNLLNANRSQKEQVERRNNDENGSSSSSSIDEESDASTIKSVSSEFNGDNNTPWSLQQREQQQEHPTTTTDSLTNNKLGKIFDKIKSSLVKEELSIDENFWNKKSSSKSNQLILQKLEEEKEEEEEEESRKLHQEQKQQKEGIVRTKEEPRGRSRRRRSNLQSLAKKPTAAITRATTTGYIQKKQARSPLLTSSIMMDIFSSSNMYDEEVRPHEKDMELEINLCL